MGMSDPARLSIGVEGLDALLGGGLLPGTLTVVVGSTGIGKTQLGLQFAWAGQREENRPGIIFDMSARGDSQHHAEYARRMFGWQFEVCPPPDAIPAEDLFRPERRQGDYLHVFRQHGRRVTRRDLDFDAWQMWQAELARGLNATIAFFYGNFVRGVRRAVIDGIEFELAEYIYHQILRKDAEWVARDLLRQDFRRHAEEVARHVYDPASIGCMLLYTSHETTLEGLIERPLDEGDLLSNASSLIYLGKIRDGTKFRRAMYVAKHRGSACTDEIIPYRIEAGGLRLDG